MSLMANALQNPQVSSMIHDLMNNSESLVHMNQNESPSITTNHLRQTIIVPGVCLIPMFRPSLYPNQVQSELIIDISVKDLCHVSS